MMREMVAIAVDDSADDLRLMQIAFAKSPRSVRLITLDSGEEAVAYLTGAGHYADRQSYPFPQLLILDLNMPRVSGFDVLAQLQGMDLNPRPYIVVMSTTQQPQEIKRCYALGADVFHAKPTDFTDFRQVIHRLIEVSHASAGTPNLPPASDISEDKSLGPRFRICAS